MTSKRSLAERLQGIRPRVVPPAPVPSSREERLARLRQLVRRTEAGWTTEPSAPPAGASWRRTDHDFPLALPYGGVVLEELRGMRQRETARLPISRKRPPVCLADALFLDTETSGLAGGTGTYAFLVGIGHVHQDSFRISQFLMRSMAGERPMLEELAAHAAGRKHLVTYNGEAFDMPLLETRYGMHKLPYPFAGMRHLDLLHTARRLYKPRHTSAALADLERTVLGIERDEDIPGARIPRVFFESLRSGRHPLMGAVLSHNRYDIRTLAALTVHSAERLGDRWGGESAEDIYGVGHHLFRRGEAERAALQLERALDAGLGGTPRDRCLLDLGRIRKKAGDHREAARLFGAISPEDHREKLEALQELAKIEEHRNGDVRQALLHAEDAWERLDRVPGLPPGFRKQLLARRQRLEQKLSRR